jgi:hypothetical protein
MVGELRIFCTMLAIVDLEKALKAIELTAVEAEIPHLRTEAVLNWSHSDSFTLVTGPERRLPMDARVPPPALCRRSSD